MVWEHGCVRAAKVTCNECSSSPSREKKSCCRRRRLERKNGPTSCGNNSSHCGRKKKNLEFFYRRRPLKIRGNDVRAVIAFDFFITRSCFLYRYYSFQSGLERRGSNSHGKVYWRCYFNAVSCFWSTKHPRTHPPPQKEKRKREKSFFLPLCMCATLSPFHFTPQLFLYTRFGGGFQPTRRVTLSFHAAGNQRPWEF